MGHPLITVKKINNSALSLTQKHFLLDPDSVPDEQSAYGYKCLYISSDLEIRI
jgi:hypothetical protein